MLESPLAMATSFKRRRGVRGDDRPVALYHSRTPRRRLNEVAMASGLSSIHRQIMWNRLLAVVEEQAQTLMRTAFSPIVRECGDLSAGVFDLQGRMLAQAVTGTPGHVNSMAESVKHFIRHFPIETMRDGD